MGHGGLRFAEYGDGPHIVTVREGALYLITTLDNDGRHTEPKSSNQSKGDVRAVPEVGLATTKEQGHVLLCVLPVLDAGHRCDLYDRFTRGKTALGPRAFSTKFIILIGWISCFFLRVVAREEKALTSVVAGAYSRNYDIPQRD